MSGDDIHVRLAWPGAPPTNVRPGQLVVKRVPEALSADGDPSQVGRTVIEASNHLGDRLLMGLQELRADIESELATVRAELRGLRQAVDDVSDRVQPNEPYATMDELRADVSGLRRGAPRRTGGRARPAGGEPDSTRSELARSLAPLIEVVDGLREEVSSLRRRIPLRAKGSPAGLSDDQLQRIALAIGTHLSAGGWPGAKVRAR